jgi:hypothetical protein
MSAVKRASPSPGSLAGISLAVPLSLAVVLGGVLGLGLGFANGLLLSATAAPGVPELATAATSVPPEAPLDPAADPPIVTLAGDRNLDECISAMPRPGCRTSTDTDAMQIAVFSVLIGALVLIGWRIARATRQRDRAVSAGPP